MEVVLEWIFLKTPLSLSNFETRSDQLLLQQKINASMHSNTNYISDNLINIFLTKRKIYVNKLY